MLERSGSNEARRITGPGKQTKQRESQSVWKLHLIEISWQILKDSKTTTFGSKYF